MQRRCRVGDLRQLDAGSGPPTLPKATVVPDHSAARDQARIPGQAATGSRRKEAGHGVTQ